ncbi:MAG: response regulator transcription factor [Bacteroidales bacterium]|nr:response regulator transcription factor [Bacteroidales bacterium]
MEGKYKLLLADDHEVMLNGLTAIINAEDNLRVIDTARNGSELIAKVNKLNPDLCIVDLDMPVMNGLQASETLLKQDEDIKIIMLTMHKEGSLVRKFREIGVKGYLLKTCDSDELIFAINKVLKGQAYFSDQLFYEPASAAQSESADITRITQLTKRELEITKLLCQGHSNNKIATALFISPSTVDNHRTNIMRKLEVHNIAGLIRFCIANKLG